MNLEPLVITILFYKFYYTYLYCPNEFVYNFFGESSRYALVFFQSKHSGQDACAWLPLALGPLLPTEHGGPAPHAAPRGGGDAASGGLLSRGCKKSLAYC